MDWTQSCVPGTQRVHARSRARAHTQPHIWPLLRAFIMFQGWPVPFEHLFVFGELSIHLNPAPPPPKPKMLFPSLLCSWGAGITQALQPRCTTKGFYVDASNARRIHSGRRVIARPALEASGYRDDCDRGARILP